MWLRWLPLALLMAASPAFGQIPAADLVASLLDKLAQIEKPEQRREDSLRITEAELNALLNEGGEAFALPEGVSDVEVRFERERVRARGLVDLERIPLPENMGELGGTLALLGSRFPVEIAGRFESEDGFARFEVDEVRLSALPLPRATIQSLLCSATRSRQHPNGIEPGSPFRLPYSLRRVTLRPGQALIEF
jgi:hypothetical protein